MKCIMAFGAHSDDIDIRAGATIAKYVKGGYKLVYIVVTTTASGIPDLSPNESIKIRQKEAADAAKIYNTKPVFLNFHQVVYPKGRSNKLPKNKPSIAFASQDRKSIKQIANLIIKYKPEIIFTHSPDDLHEDHYHTSALVYEAYKHAKNLLPSLKLWLWEHGGRGSVIGFFPNKFVNVERFLDTKNKAIKQHRSQCARNPKFNTLAVDNAKCWKKKSGFKLAEAFIEVR